MTIFNNCDTVVLDSHQDFLIFSTFPELRLWCWNDPRSPPFGKFRTLGGLGGLESLGGLGGLGSLGGLGGRETQICDTVVRSEPGGLKNAILSVTFFSHFQNCDTVVLESGRVLKIFHNCDAVVLDSH